MRKICYVTGTRADFGLMRNALQAIHAHEQLEVSILVTGMHLLSEYGETWKEIEECGLPVAEKVQVELSGESGAEMAIAIGQQVIGFTRALQKIKPDIVLLLGDRGEMLAGAIAALHLNIPIVHLHGGELSGTIDEPVRHAISKLAHYHFAATEQSRDRLVRMGEKPDTIFVTGAPGLDDVCQATVVERETLFKQYGLDQNLPLALVLFHPVVQQAQEAEEQTRELLAAILETGMQNLVIMPNADAGGAAIERVIHETAREGNIRTAVHVPRDQFISLLAHADVLVGNSSSGIIEAASLGTPVVNIGDRQNCRERNMNTIDVNTVREDIKTAIMNAREMKGQTWNNVYGDGKASDRIVDCLLKIDLSPEILEKQNAY